MVQKLSPEEKEHRAKERLAFLLEQVEDLTNRIFSSSYRPVDSSASQSASQSQTQSLAEPAVQAPGQLKRRGSITRRHQARLTETDEDEMILLEAAGDLKKKKSTSSSQSQSQEPEVTTTTTTTTTTAVAPSTTTDPASSTATGTPTPTPPSPSTSTPTASTTTATTTTEPSSSSSSSAMAPPPSTPPRSMQRRSSMNAGHTPTRLVAQPSVVTGGKMRPYQLEGLNWLVNIHDLGINGILADEMGLGKTMQSISLLGFLKSVRGENGPHLVIAPKSTLTTWENEVKRWCPDLTPIRFHGSKEERAEMIETEVKPGGFDILITSYEIAMIEKGPLTKIHWGYLVVDEAHRIKNEQSKLSRILRMYRTQHRLLLTGTPLQNNLRELWALLNFLLPDKFPHAEEFESWFSLGEGDTKKEVISTLHKILRPFILRRLKVEVERLPPKSEMLLFVGMTEVQKQWYRSLLMRDLDTINGLGADKMRLLNIVMQLRKCCNHPYLFQGAEPVPYVEGEHLVQASGKLTLLDQLLTRLMRNPTNKFLIFSQMTRLLDILEDYCCLRGYQYCRIDGSTTLDDREAQIQEFNDITNTQKRIFLLSTRAGGLGINLATANFVILYDSDWNPQVDLQAQDRAHRIGQRRPVQVFRLVTEHAVEEKIVERASMKLHLDRIVIQQGRLVDQSTALSKGDLLTMIRHGAAQMVNGTGAEGSSNTNIDLDDILDRGRSKTDEWNQQMEKRGDEVKLTLDGGYAEGSLYLWEGVDYSGKIMGPGGDWIEPPRRRGRVTSYSTDEYYREVFRSMYASDGKKKRPRTLKRPKELFAKEPKRYDFQFYPPRMYQLVKKQEDARQAYLAYEQEFLAYEARQKLRSKRNPAASSASSSSAVPSASPATSPADAPIDLASTSPESEAMDLSVDVDAASNDTSNGEEKGKEEVIDLQSPSDEPKTTNEDGEEEPPAPPDLSSMLTPDEIEEKERLHNRGFHSWSRRDFHAFLRACERHGRNNLDNIYEDLDWKKPEDIREYHRIFWRRYKEIHDWERFIGQIERGETKKKKLAQTKKTLTEYLNRFSEPAFQLNLKSLPQALRSFSKHDDRLLLHIAHKTDSYGDWSYVSKAIQKSPLARFSYFLKSRQPNELQRRAETLMRQIQRESGGLEISDGQVRVRAPRSSKTTPTAATATATTTATKNGTKRAATKPVEKQEKRSRIENSRKN